MRLQMSVLGSDPLGLFAKVATSYRAEMRGDAKQPLDHIRVLLWDECDARYSVTVTPTETQIFLSARTMRKEPFRGFDQVFMIDVLRIMSL